MRFARPVSFNALQLRGMMHRWHFMHFTVLSLCLCDETRHLVDGAPVQRSTPAYTTPQKEILANGAS